VGAGTHSIFGITLAPSVGFADSSPASQGSNRAATLRLLIFGRVRPGRFRL